MKYEELDPIEKQLADTRIDALLIKCFGMTDCAHTETAAQIHIMKEWLVFYKLEDLLGEKWQSIDQAELAELRANMARENAGKNWREITGKGRDEPGKGIIWTPGS